MKGLSNEKKPYAPPQLTVVAFKAEQGFYWSTYGSINSSPFIHLIETEEEATPFDRSDYGTAIGYQWQ